MIGKKEQNIAHCGNVVFVILCLCFCSCDKSISPSLEERLFLRAQCKAKCLRFFQSTADKATIEVPWQASQVPSEAVQHCFRNTSQVCSFECFTACDQPPAECVDSCSGNGIGCRIGCVFLLNSLEPRPGQCPVVSALSEMNGLKNKINERREENLPQSQNAVCSAECRSDNDCTDSLHKCCAAGCDQICIEPYFNFTVPPLAPSLKPGVINESSLNMELDWSATYRQSLSVCGPMVFILQTRFCACKLWDQSYVTEWQTLIMTHQFQARIDSFEPGKMYEFRIAAVNSCATRGFGPESDPYPPDPVTPNPPSPPKNLTDAMWRFYSSGTLSALLTWEAPKQSDLPVSEYMVIWAVDHGYVQSAGQSLQGLTQFSQSVLPDQFQYVIPNLKPSTTYKVQVEARSYWHGYGHLRSAPNTIFLSTHSINPVYRTSTEFDQTYTNQQEFGSVESQDCDCGENPVQDTVKFQLRKMTYNLGELTGSFLFSASNKEASYLIEWSPKACISAKQTEITPAKMSMQVSGRKSSVTLRGLHFNCRYSVKMYELHQERTTPEIGHLLLPGLLQKMSDLPAINCFCTPSCRDVEITPGSEPPECAPLDPGPPPPPSHLSIQKIGAADYHVSWLPPQRAERDTRTATGARSRDAFPIGPSGIKYRVIWAPRIDEPVSMETYNDKIGLSPIMDYQRSNVRIVEQNQTWLELKYLEQETLYIVRVQTLAPGRSGYEQESQPASIYFVTSQAENSTARTLNNPGQQAGNHTGRKSDTCIGAVFLLTLAKLLLLFLLPEEF